MNDRVPVKHSEAKSELVRNRETTNIAASIAALQELYGGSTRQSSEHRHTVVKGETLSGISQRQLEKQGVSAKHNDIYNYVNQITKQNYIKNADRILVGQEIIMPAIWAKHGSSAKTGGEQTTLKPTSDNTNKKTPSADNTNQQTPTNVDVHKLPNGDGKVTSDVAAWLKTAGSVLVSKEDQEQMVKTANGGKPLNGAVKDGPWINKDGTYDLTKKEQVSGDIPWKSTYKETASGDQLVITGNALPTTTTGKFPIDCKSKAGQIDPNPNKIEPVNFKLTIPKNPAEAKTPSPLGLGAIGVLKNGGLLYATVDETGHDANKHEVQDKNDGHPDQTYHTHQVPPVLYKGESKPGPRNVIGYAADGFPIVAAYNKNGDLYSTKELDKYHGGVFEIKDDKSGKVEKRWAYAISLDYPYTIGAFRGTPSHFEGLKKPGPDKAPPPGGPPKDCH